MRATGPDCGAQGHVSAFFVEDDAKRLVALVAELPPDLGRALISYLSLFKPSKTALQLKRAHKLASDLQQLVDAGIEQMLSQRQTLTLSLTSHNYLRAIVYDLADKADAAVERQVEASARVGKHLTPVVAKTARVETNPENALRFIEQIRDDLSGTRAASSTVPAQVDIDE